MKVEPTMRFPWSKPVRLGWAGRVEAPGSRESGPARPGFQWRSKGLLEKEPLTLPQRISGGTPAKAKESNRARGRRETEKREKD